MIHEKAGEWVACNEKGKRIVVQIGMKFYYLTEAFEIDTVKDLPALLDRDAYEFRLLKEVEL
jgi:hypothetical protein